MFVLVFLSVSILVFVLVFLSVCMDSCVYACISKCLYGLIVLLRVCRDSCVFEHVFAVAFLLPLSLIHIFITHTCHPTHLASLHFSERSRQTSQLNLVIDCSRSWQF